MVLAPKKQLELIKAHKNVLDVKYSRGTYKITYQMPDLIVGEGQRVYKRHKKIVATIELNGKELWGRYQSLGLTDKSNHYWLRLAPLLGRVVKFNPADLPMFAEYQNPIHPNLMISGASGHVTTWCIYDTSIMNDIGDEKSEYEIFLAIDRILKQTSYVPPLATQDKKGEAYFEQTAQAC